MDQTMRFGEAARLAAVQHLVLQLAQGVQPCRLVGRGIVRGQQFALPDRFQHLATLEQADRYGAVMLPKSPPHPYAAMLFIDYLLSKEGQARLQGADYFPAHPDVPASPDLDKIVPRKIGLKENYISPAKMNSDLPKSRALYQELFAK